LRARDEERFLVVLFHNHNKILSEELVFDNLDDVPNPTTIDAAGALFIEHYNDASKDSYQLYGPTGLLLNSAETQQKRQLRVRFNGETGGDEQLIGAQVYWYVPSIVTMLEIFNSDIGTNFDTDRIEIYATEEEISKEYDHGRIYANRTKLVGPTDGKYQLYTINETFQTYKNDKEHYKIYNLANFEDDKTLDTNFKYVVKTANESHITYQVYEYNGSAWVAAGTSFTKFNFSDVTFNHYVSEEALKAATGLDTNKSYLVGPNEGPFKIYKYDGTTWVATGVEIEDLTLSTIDTANYRPGYHCYYRTIGEAEKVEDSDAPAVNIEHTLFPYHIKDYYQQTSTQNSILCVVKKNGITYEASQHFTFSAFGNSGTDYTLSLTPNPEYPLITSESDLQIKTTLYDFDNKELPLPTVGVTYSWVGPTGYTTPVVQMNETGNIIGCTIEDNSVSECYNGILRCVVEDVEIPFGETKKKLINLQTDIAIPYGFNQNLYIEGASSIIYDSASSNPQYYKKPYILYNKLTNNPVDNVIWSLIHYKADGTAFTSTRTDTGFTLNGNAATSQDIINYSLNYLPQLSEDKILVPNPMYVEYSSEDQKIYTVAIAKEDKENGNVLWA
jgi:hypothetical protein